MTNRPSKDVVLLACPFCGGSVEVGHYHPDLGPSSCFVKCWCGARGTEHQYQHGDHKEAIAKAAASWNRRTVETQPATHAVRENNELSANNEAQPAASNDKPGPWWTPTAEVERLMKWCKDANTITLEISTKVLEGLLYDSLLWRKDRAAQPMKPDETSGKQPDWEAEYKKLAGVYSRTGLEDFIAKHWPGNKLVNVSAEEPRETIGLICYNPCEKHKGMSFTMTIGTPAVLVRTVCPHCEPIRPEEPAGVRIAPEKPIIDGHPIGCMCHGCHYYRKHPQCKPVKASACDCEFGPASECSGGTKERDCTCDCHAMKDSEGCPHKAVGICAACEKVK